MSVFKFLYRPLPTIPILRMVCSNANKLVVYNRAARAYSKIKSKPFRVTVCGAGGRVGQSLCLMLKQSPLIDELAVYDVQGVCGFGTELGHIDTKCAVKSYSGSDSIREAFEGAGVVVVTARLPMTAYLAYSAMFEANAHIMQEVANAFSLYCPNALLAIATNPINSLVPLASEVIKSNGVYDPKKIFGITTLDVIRANTFVAEVQGLEPECVTVPVIGGHSNNTIIPVLSQAKPCSDFSIEELENITKSVQTARETIIKVKSKKPATLSNAFAVAKFVLSLIKGLKGHKNVIECAYVRSSAHPHSKYLATPLLLGPNGVEKNLGVPELSEYENCLLQNAIPLIVQNIKRGEAFVGVKDPPPCDPCDPNPKAPPCPPDWCAKQEIS